MNTLPNLGADLDPLDPEVLKKQKVPDEHGNALEDLDDPYAGASRKGWCVVNVVDKLYFVCCRFLRFSSEGVCMRLLHELVIHTTTHRFMSR